MSRGATSAGALALVLALVGTAFARAPQEGGGIDPTVPGRFDRAVGAYRAGDYETARTIWRSLLTEQLGRADRGKVLYNLGNAAYRSDELMEAVAWYTSCVRTTPRDADAWRNLEFVRREAELEPADRGDLSATTTRLLESVDPDEAGWLVMIALGAWTVVLLLEALRGGAFWRRMALIGVPVVLACAAPLAWRATRHEVAPHLVTERPAAPMRAEPSLEMGPVGQATAGDVVEKVDELGEWARIETADGLRGWVPEESVFELR